MSKYNGKNAVKKIIQALKNADDYLQSKRVIGRVLMTNAQAVGNCQKYSELLRNSNCMPSKC